MIVNMSEQYYLPYGWNVSWARAISNVMNNQVNVLGIGDSITQGWGSSDVLQTSWWALLRQSLINRYIYHSGDFYSLMLSSQAVSTFGGPGTATYPYVMTGTINTNFGIFTGIYNYGVFNDTAQPNVLTFTSLYACTAMDIIYINGFQAGSWTYAVDGGTPVTVNTSGSGNPASGALTRISITGLTNNIHKIAISSLDANFGSMAIGGVIAYKSKVNGIEFANMGWPGMGLVLGSQANNNLSDNGSMPIDRLAIYQGFTGTTATPTTLTGFGFPAQPDLAIIALGVNDASAGVTVAQYTTSLTNLIYSIRFGKHDATSIIIMGMWGPDGKAASSTTVTNTDYTGTATPSYALLRQAMLQVAQIFGCAYIDIYSSFGRYPVTNGLITSVTDLHPTNLGHSIIANLVNNIL